MKSLIFTGLIFLSSITFGSETSNMKKFKFHQNLRPLDQVCPEIISNALKSEAHISSQPTRIMSIQLSQLISKSISDSLILNLEKGINSQEKKCAKIKIATINANQAVSSILERHSKLDEIEYSLKKFKFN